MIETSANNNQWLTIEVISCSLINAYVPGFEVYCMAIISMEEADRFTYAGMPPSLRVEPTATHKSFSYFIAHDCHIVLHLLVLADNQTSRVLHWKHKVVAEIHWEMLLWRSISHIHTNTVRVLTNGHGQEGCAQVLYDVLVQERREGG